jgi:O-acetyl-ADP-ribose deacetylase (regulator of RNase III)
MAKPKIKLIRGDITQIEADAIVNAANSSLMGGGGVDGAIHLAAGPGLLEECKKIREERLPDGLQTGMAVLTKAYNLPAKFVIHTVGPIYNKDDINLLRKCYLNSLKLAEENNCRKILFPAISTGVYGVPVETSAKIVKEVLDGFESDVVGEIGLVLFSEADYEIYGKYFG